MSATGNILRVLKVSRQVLSKTCGHSLSRSYAKKPIATGASQKAHMEVETDPERLLSHCCGVNIYVEGEDPELKPDSDYPDWLWNLSVDRKPPDLSELDPDDPYYWRRVSRIIKLREMRIRKRLNKIKDIQSPLNPDKNN